MQTTPRSPSPLPLSVAAAPLAPRPTPPRRSMMLAVPEQQPPHAEAPPTPPPNRSAASAEEAVQPTSRIVSAPPTDPLAPPLDPHDFAFAPPRHPTAAAAVAVLPLPDLTLHFYDVRPYPAAAFQSRNRELAERALRLDPSSHALAPLPLIRPCAVISNHPLTRARVTDPFCYYEVRLGHVQTGVLISIGLASGASFDETALPGGSAVSVGLLSDGSRSHRGSKSATSCFAYHPRGYGAGDVVGCGFVPALGSVFFTLNGTYLGEAFSLKPRRADGAMRSIPFHAAVGADAGCVLECNFGARVFCYEPANEAIVYDSSSAEEELGSEGSSADAESLAVEEEGEEEWLHEEPSFGGADASAAQLRRRQVVTSPAQRMNSLPLNPYAYDHYRRAPSSVTGLSADGDGDGEFERGQPRGLSTDSSRTGLRPPPRTAQSGLAAPDMPAAQSDEAHAFPGPLPQRQSSRQWMERKSLAPERVSPYGTITHSGQSVARNLHQHDAANASSARHSYSFAESPRHNLTVPRDFGSSRPTPLAQLIQGSGPEERNVGGETKKARFFQRRNKEGKSKEGKKKERKKEDKKKTRNKEDRRSVAADLLSAAPRGSPTPPLASDVLLPQDPYATNRHSVDGGRGRTENKDRRKNRLAGFLAVALRRSKSIEGERAELPAADAEEYPRHAKGAAGRLLVDSAFQSTEGMFPPQPAPNQRSADSASSIELMYYSLSSDSEDDVWESRRVPSIDWLQREVTGVFVGRRKLSKKLKCKEDNTSWVSIADVPGDILLSGVKALVVGGELGD